MAKNQKRISINSIDKILKAEKTDSAEVVYSTPEGDIIQATVKRRISFQDFHNYVSCVVGSVFIESDDETSYMPENLDPAHILATLEYYTNIKSDMKIDKLYEFGMTDFYNKIIEQIDSVQYSALKTAISSAIEYRKQELLSSQKDLLKRNVEKIESLIDTVSKFAALYGNVNIPEMTETLQKIADKDERALVNAIVSLRTEESASQASPKEDAQIDGQVDFDSINLGA